MEETCRLKGLDAYRTVKATGSKGTDLTGTEQTPAIEDRYALSPLQEGMLFHSLQDTGVGMYVNQVAYAMEDIDIKAMQEA